MGFSPWQTCCAQVPAPCRQGRPKQTRAAEVQRMVVEIAKGSDMLGDLLRDAAKGRSKIHLVCFLPR